MSKKRRMFFHMITASLTRRKSRMLVALLAIVVGAMILSGLITIYRDVPRQMGAQFRNYGANMILTAQDESFSEEDFQTAISQIPSANLVGATPYHYEMVELHYQPIQVAATDMEGLQKTSPYWSVDGEWPQTEKEVLVGEQVADNLSLKIGDTAELIYAVEEDGESKQNRQNFRVTGIVSTGGNEEGYMYVTFSGMENLTTQSSEYELAELSISGSSEELQAYMESINESIPSIRASLVKRVTASETTVLSKLQALVFLVTIIVLALTMICVATTMTAVISERRKEIGLRKALGASDRSIVMEFMGESMMLGAVGGLIGSFLGFAFAQFVSSNVFDSTIMLHPALVPISIIVSILVTAIASMLPIRSATTIDPALVLKGE